MLFEKMHSAWKAHDLEAQKSFHHSEYTFVSHAMGKTMTKDDMSDEMILGMMQTIKPENQRSIYEDNNILVQHSVTTFATGDKEAVMAVHIKKDSLIWKTETGATPL